MRSSPTLLLAALAAGLVACGDGTSSVRVTARDAGSADQALTQVTTGAYSEIYLDVVDILVRHEGDEESWTDILEGTTTIDLIALQNGDLAELTVAAIAPGTITELRLVLAEGDQGHAVNADGYFVPIRVPSGSTSGLKIKGTIVVPEGEDVEIPLAIDLDRALAVTKDGVLRIDPVIWLTAPSGDGAGDDDGDDDDAGTDPGTEPGTDPGTDPGPGTDPM